VTQVDTSHQAIAPLAAANVMEAAVGRDVELLIPEHDEANPEVSIVVPAVDERITISELVAWCHEGLQRAGVRGEILIVDSSSDETAELALAAGARVLKTPRRGLGRAYIDAVPFIRAEYVILGDADCTYDFRQLGVFVTELQAGNEFAMGSRWKGTIEAGSMPFLHQHLGTPVTTWILNRLYHSHFSDIHCGMRGITRDALTRMGLRSQSWEYASEMVIKSIRMDLRTAEVPVTFLKDRDGRVSHHRRAGWWSPFKAAWINMRAMFVYGADFFAFKPGVVLLALGLVLTLPLSVGALRIGSVTFSLYWMLLGVTLSIIGLQSVFFACLAQVLCDYTGRARRRWLEVFRYTRATVVSLVMFSAGILAASALVVRWVGGGLVLPPASDPIDHIGLLGLFLMICGFSTFVFTLLLHATGVRYGQMDTVDEA